ncbi:hypothetical protein BC1002_7159 (plasmid) [Paraburkholderia atlantica]|uniref:Uncharacterized protein n=2 Tax=Paraburkholderia atlantica TaxID=2654982 RepID=D5WNM6_PARAM|nr:hypothetical protein [Paraburkholderia atlantica]ADG20905.1 hypothetical protein BC1002_7159 [Paraburkholderia atlantica]
MKLHAVIVCAPTIVDIGLANAQVPIAKPEKMAELVSQVQATADKIAAVPKVSSAAHAQAGRYVATDADSSASQLVSLDGRTVKWNATGDFPLHNAARLNARGQLATAANLDDAFERVAKLAHEEKPEAPALFACAYQHGTVALEVREVGQPECGKRLN